MTSGFYASVDLTGNGDFTDNPTTPVVEEVTGPAYRLFHQAKAREVKLREFLKKGYQLLEKLKDSFGTTAAVLCRSHASSKNENGEDCDEQLSLDSNIRVSYRVRIKFCVNGFRSSQQLVGSVTRPNDVTDGRPDTLCADGDG